MFFDLDSAVLTPSDTALIAAYASQYVASGGGQTINVTGFASVEGDDNVNQKLSLDRAKAVIACLMANKVPASQIGEPGQGGPTIQFSNDDPRQNRVATINPFILPTTVVTSDDKDPGGSGGAPRQQTPNDDHPAAHSEETRPDRPPLPKEGDHSDSFNYQLIGWLIIAGGVVGLVVVIGGILWLSKDGVLLHALTDAEKALIKPLPVGGPAPAGPVTPPNAPPPQSDHKDPPKQPPSSPPKENPSPSPSPSPKETARPFLTAEGLKRLRSSGTRFVNTGVPHRGNRVKSAVETDAGGRKESKYQCPGGTLHLGWDQAARVWRVRCPYRIR